MSLRSWTAAAALAAALSAPMVLLAQSGSGVLTGIVKDTSGGAIPGAQVRVLNEDTGVAVESVTNQEGTYRVGALVPGSYRVDVELSGFEPVSRRPLTLQVGQTLAIDLTLDVAKRTEEVTVVASAPLIESQSSNIGQVVTQQMLDALPLPNRAASSLVALAPGVIMIDPGVGTAENYPIFSVAGGRARNQNFILDGGNASNAVGLTRPQQLTALPVDAMQEFKVITNNYSAEYGHSTGGVVTMSTRSGTNQFRGTVFESLQNDALNARNFFAVTKPPIRLNQFGGTFGGPVTKGKTFFFGSWERTRQLTSEPIISTVPTLLNREGDFSDLRSSEGQPIAIYDPQTRQPFPGNVIPKDRLDPIALAALGYFPLPNREGTSTNANNYVGTNESTLDRDIVVGKVDHKLGINDLLTVRYYINNSGTNVTGSYPDPNADPLADATSVRIQSLTGAHTHIFSPTLVNELRVTYLRRKFIDQHPGLGANLAGAIGLTGVSDQAFPVFTIPGYGSLVTTAGNASGQIASAALGSANVSRFQTPILDTQVLDSISWSRGTHAYKFGLEFRAGANNETRDRGSSGILTFSPLITSNLGATNSGNALAAYMLGEVNAGSVQTSDLIQTRAAYWALYAQDDWRLTSRLTLNYGIRWEAELPRREINNKMNSFDPLAINPVSGTPGVVTFAGQNGTPERAFATDLNNFGPRMGFAYQLDGSGRTVLRGGTGVFHGPTVSNSIGDVAALGFSTSASFVVAQATTQSAFLLRDGFPAYARPDLTPAFGAVPVGQRPNTSVAYFDPNQVTPVSYQTNLDLQHELRSGLLVEGGFISNLSRHLTANDFSLNQVPPQLLGPGNTQVLRPFPQFSNVTLINPSIGRSDYYAGFVRVQKRFSDGFSVLAHYTRSKYMDDVESSNEYGASGSFMDAYHRELDWARSASDVPNHFVLSVLYEVRPFTKNSFVNAALANWRVGVLETLQSGPPFTVVTTANTTNAFPAGPLRPNLVGDPELPSDERTLTQWFNTSAFVNPANFTFGDSPRSVLRGPGIVTTDLTLEKTIPLAGQVRFDLRVEAYNLLNRANFNIPGFTLGAADFGAISSARPARTVQLGARLSF
jgi:Carboxypeptidase regulatory-like domain/TonB-dependent Receptor Plug Domain